MLGLFNADDCKPDEGFKEVLSPNDHQNQENDQQSPVVCNAQSVPVSSDNSEGKEPEHDETTFSKEITKSGKIPTNITVKIFSALQNIIINNCDFKPVSLECNNTKINDITPNNNTHIAVYEKEKRISSHVNSIKSEKKEVTRSSENSDNISSDRNCTDSVQQSVERSEINSYNLADMALFVTEDVINHVRAVYNDVNNYEEVVFKLNSNQRNDSEVVLLQIIKKINFYVTFIDDKNEKQSSICMISLTRTSDASILCTYKSNRPFRKADELAIDDMDSSLNDDEGDVEDLSDESFSSDELNEGVDNEVCKIENSNNEVIPESKYNLRHLKIDFRSLVGANNSNYNQDWDVDDIVRKNDGTGGKKRVNPNNVPSKNKKLKRSDKYSLANDFKKEEEIITDNMDDILAYHRLVNRNSLNKNKKDRNEQMLNMKELKIVLEKCDKLITYNGNNKLHGVFKCSSSSSSKKNSCNKRSIADKYSKDTDEETIENIQLFISNSYNNCKVNKSIEKPIKTAVTNKAVVSKRNKNTNSSEEPDIKPLVIIDVRGNVTEHLMDPTTYDETSIHHYDEQSDEEKKVDENHYDEQSEKKVDENHYDEQSEKKVDENNKHCNNDNENNSINTHCIKKEESVKNENEINDKKPLTTAANDKINVLLKTEGDSDSAGNKINDNDNNKIIVTPEIDDEDERNSHGSVSDVVFHEVVVMTYNDKRTEKADTLCTNFKEDTKEISDNRTVPCAVHEKDDIKINTRIYAYIEETETSMNYIGRKVTTSEQKIDDEFVCTDYEEVDKKLSCDDKVTGLLTEDLYVTNERLEITNEGHNEDESSLSSVISSEKSNIKGIGNIGENIEVINCIVDDVTCDEDNILLEHSNDVVIVKQNVEGVMELDLVEEEDNIEYVNNDDQIVIIKRALDDIINDDLDDEVEDFNGVPELENEDTMNDSETAIVNKLDCIKTLTFNDNVVNVVADDKQNSSLESNNSSMKMITCKICKKEVTKESLRRHLYRHSGVKFCPFCSKSYNNNTEYYNHIRSHKDNQGNEKYMCYICKKKFCFVKNIYKHMLTAHTENADKDTIILLPDNGKNNKNDIFFTKEKKEKKRLMVSCNYCDQHVSSVYYKRHVLTHTGERPFTCLICEKRFFENSTLKNHMRTHTGERPYKCEHCDKKFGHISTLSKHLNTHTGFKRYPCTICSKLMSSSYNLKQHMRTHTGEKPFSCDWCGKKFSSKSGLEKHIGSMHR